MNKTLARIGLTLLLLGLMAAPALADWTDYADPIEPVIEDDPAWDKYAFDLPYAVEDGKLSFVELARSGDPFVLYWWLTDCSMCHLQMPYMQQLHNQAADKEIPLRVVSICVDSDSRDCVSYVEDKKIKFDVLFDGHSRKTDKAFGVREEGTPLVYVFKGGGVLAGKTSGFSSNIADKVYEMLEIDPDAVQAPDEG